MSSLGAISLNSDGGGPQYIEVDHNSKIDFPSDNFFVSLWFKTTSSTFILPRTMAWKADGTVSAPDDGWCLAINDGNVIGQVDQKGVTSDATYNDGNWHWAMLVVDRTRAKIHLFVDRTLKSDNLPTSEISTNTRNIRFGAPNNPSIPLGNIFVGSLAEIRIGTYSEDIKIPDALPVAQESDIPGTRLLFHFNESHSDTVYDYSSNTVSATDSPTRTNGTVVNFDSDANVWDTSGPLLVPPMMISRELILYTIDQDSDIQDYATENRMKTYRGRQRDEEPFRDRTPQISVVPIRASLPTGVEHSFSFQTIRTMVQIVGVVSPDSPTPQQPLEELNHLVLKALYRRKSETNDTFGDYQVMKSMIGNSFFEMGQGEGLLAPAFRLNVTFDFIRDLRDSSQP